MLSKSLALLFFFYVPYSQSKWVQNIGNVRTGFSAEVGYVNFREPNELDHTIMQQTKIDPDYFTRLISLTTKEQRKKLCQKVFELPFYKKKKIEYDQLIGNITPRPGFCSEEFSEYTPFDLDSIKVTFGRASVQKTYEQEIISCPHVDQTYIENRLKGLDPKKYYVSFGKNQKELFVFLRSKDNSNVFISAFVELENFLW